MKISTTALELAALCLAIIVLAAFGSPEAVNHPRLMVLGALVAVFGISMVILPGLIQGRS